MTTSGPIQEVGSASPCAGAPCCCSAAGGGSLKMFRVASLKKRPLWCTMGAEYRFSGCRAVEVLHPARQRCGLAVRSGSAVPTKEAPVCAGAEDCEVGFAGVPDLQAYDLNSRCRVLVPCWPGAIVAGGLRGDCYSM
jgi:hypothetical protein